VTSAGVDRYTLKAYRKQLGLSLAQAAAQVGVTARAWCRYESGDRRLPVPVARLFCLTNGIALSSVRRAPTRSSHAEAAR
jgi:transcriptional regulator with XRE-family HTH domain